MAIGAALAIGQKLLSGIINNIKDCVIEKAAKKEEELTKRLNIQEQTKQLEIQKEIAEKGLEQSVNSLQEQQEKTKQIQIQSSASTYNTFVENITKQTQYNVNNLSTETNDYLATFRPKHTEKVFESIIKLMMFSGGYYTIISICILILFVISKETAVTLIATQISFKDTFLIPIPNNIVSSLLCFPLIMLYWLYEQWSYQQTYWFISRDEEKERMLKKKS